MVKQSVAIQGSLFEDDFLIRTLGQIANSPDIALTELVANAWDAGASVVKLHIPEEKLEELIIEDDGVGMTSEQFRRRWMTLGYNRLKHQGELADFPPNKKQNRRRAYGRNGVGRHGMLCFGKEYIVETFRDGKGAKFLVAATSGKEPFALLKEEPIEGAGSGTRLIVKVERNLPQAKHIRDMISARFLYDPQFQVYVNDISVELAEQKGLIDQTILKVDDNTKVEAFFIDSSKNARTAQQHGIAFWVGNRLVGEPSWVIGGKLIDGRTWIAKRHTVVIKSDDLFNEVKPDWSGFIKSIVIEKMYKVVSNYVELIRRKLLSDKIEDRKKSVLREHSEEISKLRQLGKYEITEFVEELTLSQPSISEEFVSAAVKAVINLEKSRSGVALLQKLSTLSEEDIEGLNRLLDDWTVKDALTVLDEIDRRLVIIQALEKLSSDPNIDELKTLHPLVSQSRWLFGPEFDSHHFSSNISLRNAVEKIFGKRVDTTAFINSRKRPDLVVLKEATISTVGTEEFDEISTLIKLGSILVIELKRGGFSIGREEINQASNYVDDFINCELLDGLPKVRAFVVGHRVDNKVSKCGTVGDRGRWDVCTYGQLVRTASKRLFRLRDHLIDRYKDIPELKLVDSVINEPRQLSLSTQYPQIAMALDTN